MSITIALFEDASESWFRMANNPGMEHCFDCCRENMIALSWDIAESHFFLQNNYLLIKVIRAEFLGKSGRAQFSDEGGTRRIWEEMGKPAAIQMALTGDVATMPHLLAAITKKVSVQRIWRMYDSQFEILALAFR